MKRAKKRRFTDRPGWNSSRRALCGSGMNGSHALVDGWKTIGQGVSVLDFVFSLFENMQSYEEKGVMT